VGETQSNPALAAAESYEKNAVTYTTGPFAAILLELANPQPGEHVVLESAGFADVTIVARSYTVRQPRNPQLITQTLTNAAIVDPAFTAMNMEERSTLAHAVEREIGPAFRNYLQGDEEVYPRSAHIAVARKL